MSKESCAFFHIYPDITLLHTAMSSLCLFVFTLLINFFTGFLCDVSNLGNIHTCMYTWTLNINLYIYKYIYICTYLYGHMFTYILWMNTRKYAHVYIFVCVVTLFFKPFLSTFCPYFEGGWLNANESIRNRETTKRK